MKKVVLMLLTSLILISVSASAVFIYPPQPKTRPAKIYPQYLLCLRYWTYNSSVTLTLAHSLGGETLEPREYKNDWNWTYLYETYNTIDEVIERLNTYINTYTGGGLEELDNLVGLWKLDNNLVDNLLKHEVIEYIEPEHIKENKWTETKWSIKGEQK